MPDEETADHTNERDEEHTEKGNTPLQTASEKLTEGRFRILYYMYQHNQPNKCNDGSKKDSYGGEQHAREVHVAKNRSDDGDSKNASTAPEKSTARFAYLFMSYHGTQPDHEKEASTRSTKHGKNPDSFRTERISWDNDVTEMTRQGKVTNSPSNNGCKKQDSNSPSMRNAGVVQSL